MPPCSCWKLMQSSTSFTRGKQEKRLSSDNVICMQAHSDASKQPLQAYVAYDKPRDVEKLVGKINKQAIGKTFKKDGKPLLEALEAIKEELKDDKGPLACARDRCGSLQTRACFAEHVYCM